MDFSFNIIDQALVNHGFDINNRDYLEFNNDLVSLEALLDNSIIFEAVDNIKGQKSGSAQKIIKNTIDTTENIGKAYKDVTDAGGTTIKTWWDLMMKLVHLITKIISYIFSKIGNLGAFIGKCAERIGRIPSDVKNKIQGNIKLYITANDLTQLYNNGLMLQLTNFINECKILSTGEMWSTMFNKRSSTAQMDNGKLSQNDMKVCKSLQKYYAYFSNLKFTPSIIDMRNKTNVQIYFDKDYKLKLTDIDGSEKQFSYYQGLTSLCLHINDCKETLTIIKEDLGDKFNETQSNQNFYKLNRFQQDQVVKTIQMVSKTIEIVGNIVKYIIADINTISKEVAVIEKAQNKMQEGKKSKMNKQKQKAIKDVKLDENTPRGKNSAPVTQ